MERKEWNKILKEIMKEKRMTQHELAEKSGIANSSVCRYLSGERKPRIDVLKNFAKALSVNIDTFIQVDDDFSPFDSIKLSIARHGSKLTEDEQKELVDLILGKKN